MRSCDLYFLQLGTRTVPNQIQSCPSWEFIYMWKRAARLSLDVLTHRLNIMPTSYKSIKMHWGARAKQSAGGSRGPSATRDSCLGENVMIAAVGLLFFSDRDCIWIRRRKKKETCSRTQRRALSLSRPCCLLYSEFTSCVYFRSGRIDHITSLTVWTQLAVCLALTELWHDRCHFLSSSSSPSSSSSLQCGNGSL